MPGELCSKGFKSNSVTVARVEGASKIVREAKVSVCTAYRIYIVKKGCFVRIDHGHIQPRSGEQCESQ